MPKIKTRRAAAKRFVPTGTLGSKADYKRVAKCLPYA